MGRKFYKLADSGLNTEIHCKRVQLDLLGFTIFRANPIPWLSSNRKGYKNASTADCLDKCPQRLQHSVLAELKKEKNHDVNNFQKLFFYTDLWLFLPVSAVWFARKEVRMVQRDVEPKGGRVGGRKAGREIGTEAGMEKMKFRLSAR